MLPKLSVARTANVETVSVVTNEGVPEIIPDEDIENPAGKLPLSNEYVTVTAGITALADRVYVATMPAG